MFDSISRLVKSYLHGGELASPQVHDTTNNDPLVSAGFTKIGPNQYRLDNKPDYAAPQQVMPQHSLSDSISSYLHNLFQPKSSPAPTNPPTKISASAIKSTIKSVANPSTTPSPTNSSLVSNPSLDPYYQSIVSTGKKYGIDPAVLASQLSRESAGFQDKYVHGYHTDGTGRGIAGIDKKYHPEISDDQAFDPNFAIDWMGSKMKGLMGTTGSLYDALRMYNGGGNYDSSTPGFQGVPVSTRTKQYADAIMQNAQALKGLKQ